MFVESPDGKAKTFTLNGFLHSFSFDCGNFPCELAIISIDGYVIFERMQFNAGIHTILPRHHITPVTIDQRRTGNPSHFDRLYFKNARVVVDVTQGQIGDFVFRMVNQ